MVFLRHWLLIFCALVLGGGNLLAASREERAFATASADFQAEMWGRAETGFDQFTKNFRQSTNVPAAALFKAQAQFRQKKFAAAIATLTAGQASAGGLADQFANWIAEAHYAAGELSEAATAYESLVKKYPESPLRLRATVSAASAWEKLGDWKRLSGLMQDTNGVFAKKASLDAANELVSRGWLLLAHAKMEQKDFAGAAGLLALVKPEALPTDLDWQRAHLLCDVNCQMGDYDAALRTAANLAQIAQVEKNDRHRAESVAMRAGILEKQGRTEESLAAWRENLAPGMPDEWQRQAVLKVAELAAVRSEFVDAEQAQENFLRQFPDSPQADIALLSLGELHLKDYVANLDTNHLRQATAQFDRLLEKFPNSPQAGRGLLNRGWCRWLSGDEAGSLADFQAAVQKDLSPDDLAVARFKAGDVLFARKDFRGALGYYGAVLKNFPGGSAAEKELVGRALYQSLRAELEVGDVAGAGATFEKLFPKFSDGELGQGSALLYGESLVNPVLARALFEKLAPKFAGAALEPELRLAVARTFEQEPDWQGAVKAYEAWLKDFPASPLRAQADYALASAKFHAGDEAGALVNFTQFVQQNPTNAALAPLSQWWIAEHYFRAGEFVGAETNYEYTFQTKAWKESPLYHPAQLMAGRAAMGRASYKDAAAYFAALVADTNCPADLRVQGRFAWGAALMHMDATDTNSQIASLQLATNLFSQIIREHPTNELGARAWGELADCAQLLGDFAVATNAYARVFADTSKADASARGRALVGNGLVLEKMATQSGQTNLLEQALNCYLSVFRGDNQDPFWVKKAGLQAAPLVGRLNQPESERKFYEQLKAQLPQLAAAIDKKISTLSPEKKD